MSDANTRYLRAARARLRAAATLLRQSTGLESMAPDTAELLRLEAIELDSRASWLTEREREANAHVATWNRRRRSRRRVEK